MNLATTFIIIEALEKLSVKLTKRYNRINYGGCCMVAAHMAELLSNTEFISDVHILVDNMGDNQIKRQRSRNKRPQDWYLTFNHGVVSFKLDGLRYTWDSDQLFLWENDPEKSAYGTAT